MTTPALVMMLVAMAVIWGGLALAVWNILTRSSDKPGSTRRDL